MRTVVLDTDDPPALAAFYSALLDWPETQRADDWITLTERGSGARLAFQLATDFQPPTWPGSGVPQQLHLDLTVTDLAEAGAYAVSLGARPVDGPENDPSFEVYLDPSGHPFCLCVDEV